MRSYTEGEVLKVLREQFQPRAGETQTQTAARLGVSVSYIHQVLGGQKPLADGLIGALGFKEIPRRFRRA